MKVLASCDPIYYRDHATAFLSSCRKVDMTGIVKVRNQGTKEDFSRNRFIIAEEFIEPEGVFITDIDCYFNKKLPVINEDVGIFLREYEKFPGMKVAAGLLWLNNTENAKKFIRKVKEELLTSKLGWYADQYALYNSYNEFKDEISFFIFDKHHMDWEFNDHTYMWTGKGSRKNNNKTYLDRKKYYESINT
jgi:hypothetical protein